MTRRAVLLLVFALIVLIPVQAQAVGVWDPNDVRGPFDLRWVGATHTSTGRIKLTATFYAGFDVDKIPHRGPFGPGVWFQLDQNLTGFFWVNEEDEVVFSLISGISRSSSSGTYPVAQPAPRTLVVRYHPIDAGEPGSVVRGLSQWRREENRARDWTRTFELAA